MAGTPRKDANCASNIAAVLAKRQRKQASDCMQVAFASTRCACLVAIPRFLRETRREGLNCRDSNTLAGIATLAMAVM